MGNIDSKNQEPLKTSELISLINNANRMLEIRRMQSAFYYAEEAANGINNLLFEEDENVKEYQKREITLSYAINIAKLFLNIATYYNALIHEGKIKDIGELETADKSLSKAKQILDFIRINLNKSPILNDHITASYQNLLRNYEYLLTSFAEFKLKKLKTIERKLNVLNSKTQNNPDKKAKKISRININELISRMDLQSQPPVLEANLPTKQLKIPKNIDKSKEPILYKLFEYLKKTEELTVNDIKEIENLTKKGSFTLKDFIEWLSSKNREDGSQKINWLNLLNNLSELKDIVQIVELAYGKEAIDKNELKNILTVIILPKFKKEYKKINKENKLIERIIKLALEAGYTDEELLIYLESSKTAINTETKEEKEKIKEKIAERRLVNGLQDNNNYKPKTDDIEAIDYIQSVLKFKIDGQNYDGKFGEIYFKLKNYNQFDGLSWLYEKAPDDPTIKNISNLNHPKHKIEVDMMILPKANLFIPQPGELDENSIKLEPNKPYKLIKNDNGSYLIDIDTDHNYEQFNIKYNASFYDIPFDSNVNQDFSPDNSKEFTDFYTKHKQLRLSQDAENLLSQNGNNSDFDKIKNTLTWVGNNIKWSDLSNPVAKEVQENFEKLNGSKHYVEYILSLPPEKRLADCDLRTTVALTLLRMQGIPCRAAVGHMSDTSNVYGPHGWLEVYIVGYGWYKVDIMEGQVTNENRIEGKDVKEEAKMKEKTNPDKDILEKPPLNLAKIDENTDTKTPSDSIVPIIPEEDEEANAQKKLEERQKMYEKFLHIINETNGVNIVSSESEYYYGRLTYPEALIQRRYEQNKQLLIDYIKENKIPKNIGQDEFFKKFMELVCTELHDFDTHNGNHFSLLSPIRTKDLYFTLKDLLKDENLPENKKSFLRYCLLNTTTSYLSTDFRSIEPHQNDFITSPAYDFLKTKKELQFLEQSIDEESKDDFRFLEHSVNYSSLLKILPPNEAQALAIKLSTRFYNLIINNKFDPAFFSSMGYFFEILLIANQKQHIDVVVQFFFSRYHDSRNNMKAVDRDSDQSIAGKNFVKLLLASSKIDLQKKLFELDGNIELFVSLINHGQIAAKELDSQISAILNQGNSWTPLYKDFENLACLSKIRDLNIRKKIFNKCIKAFQSSDNEDLKGLEVSNYLYKLYKTLFPEQIQPSNSYLQDFLSDIGKETVQIYYGYSHDQLTVNSSIDSYIDFPNDTKEKPVLYKTSDLLSNCIIIGRLNENPAYKKDFKEYLKLQATFILDYSLNDINQALSYIRATKDIGAIRIVFEERLRQILLFNKDRRRFASYMGISTDLYDSEVQNNAIEYNYIYNKLSKLDANREISEGIRLLSEMIFKEKGIEGFLEEIPNIFRFIKEAINSNLLSNTAIFNLSESLGEILLNNLDPQNVKSFALLIMKQLLKGNLMKQEETFYILLLQKLLNTLPISDQFECHKKLFDANYNILLKGNFDNIYADIPDKNNLLMLSSALSHGTEEIIDIKKYREMHRQNIAIEAENCPTQNVLDMLEKLPFEKIKLNPKEKMEFKKNIISYIGFIQNKQAQKAYENYMRKQVIEKTGEKIDINEADLYKQFTKEEYIKHMNPPEIQKVIEISKRLGIQIEVKVPTVNSLGKKTLNTQ